MTFVRGPLRARDIIIDVTVTCPLPDAELTGALPEVQGRAAQREYAGENSDYKVLALENNLEFRPMVMESTGYLHEETRKFIKEVTKHASELKHIP